MKHIVCAILSLSFLGVAFGDDVSRFESRLNELMIWKLSDEMALKPQEEQQLKTVLKKYQDQRKQALVLQEAALTNLGKIVKKSPTVQACPECLVQIQNSQSKMSAANAGEFKELKTLLGEARLGKFLVIRSEMTRDVRDALRQPAQSSSTGK